MTEQNQSAAPGIGPEGLPTPSLPSNDNAGTDIGPEGLPTPSLPGNNNAGTDIGPESLPTPSLPGPAAPAACPIGYYAKTAGESQTFTDLLLENDVSYQALRVANPALSTGSIAPGVRYCAPPAGTRRLCRAGRATYILGEGEDLAALTELLGVSAGLLLYMNPLLAPSDFIPGRVVCIP